MHHGADNGIADASDGGQKLAQLYFVRSWDCEGGRQAQKRLRERDGTMLREVSTEALTSTFPSRVTVDCEALAANARTIVSLIDADVQLMAVVKANAYGHGAARVAEIALRNGADMLAVANIGEAVELRDAGIESPILILSYVPVDMIHVALALGLIVTVFDAEQAAHYQACAANAIERLVVHIKVDSGMGRLGVAYEEAAQLCHYVHKQTALELEGVYTHFSTADSD